MKKYVTVHSLESDCNNTVSPTWSINRANASGINSWQASLVSRYLSLNTAVHTQSVADDSRWHFIMQMISLLDTVQMLHNEKGGWSCFKCLEPFQVLCLKSKSKEWRTREVVIMYQTWRRLDEMCLFKQKLPILKYLPWTSESKKCAPALFCCLEWKVRVVYEWPHNGSKYVHQKTKPFLDYSLTFYQCRRSLLSRFWGGKKHGGGTEASWQLVTNTTADYILLFSSHTIYCFPRLHPS